MYLIFFHICWYVLAASLVGVDFGMMVESDDSWGTHALRKRGGKRCRRVQPLKCVHVCVCVCVCVCEGGREGGRRGEEGFNQKKTVKDGTLM